MPELPEVETIVRDLRACVRGKTVTQATYLNWEKTFAHLGAAKFAKAVEGKCISGVERRAKRVVFELGNDLRMVVSLRMTGQLTYLGEKKPPASATRFVLELDGGSGYLRFDDARKFGRVWVFPTEQWLREAAKCGPEPLSMSEDAFIAHMQKRRGRLKPLLLNQDVIAGIGNIYADEALWLAKLHPRRLMQRLTRKQLAGLYEGVQTALRTGIENRGTSFDDYLDGRGEKGGNYEKLHVYGRKGQPCHRCGTPVRKMVSGQRGTHYCPTCQRPPRDLGAVRHVK